MTPPDTLALNPAAPAEPQPGKLNGLRLWLAATRPAFLTVTLLAVLLGLASSFFSGIPVDGLKATLTLIFALVAHAGVNVVNDYHDHLNGADAANTERQFPFTGGSRFIQNGVLSPQQTAWLGYGLLASVIPAGLWLTWQSGAGLIGIGLAGLLVGWAYSAPPLKLMSRGLGEVAIVAGWLLVVVGTDYVQRDEFAQLPLLVGLPYALLVACILFINQFPDRKGDEAVGKRTLVVRLGVDNAPWAYLFLILLANLWVLLLVGRSSLPVFAALSVFALPVSMQAARRLLRCAGRPSALRPAITQTIAACHVHGALMIAGLVLARLGF